MYSIDLHLHFDGSLSIETVRRLAELQGIDIPQDGEVLRSLLTVDKDCKNLGEYLTKFDFPLSLLQTEKSISEGMLLLCRELIAEGTVYAEIRFAPQLHLQKGLTQLQVVKAAIDGFKQSGMRGGLILCCMRGADNLKSNLETVDTAAKLLEQGVLALDLAGNEARFPTKDFKPLFEIAREHGIPYTIHAGEADGAHSVRDAILMGASRIGHGVRSLESLEVIELLVKGKIPLELCPTSNLNTAIFQNISEFPIRKLMELGVFVTVNSDNRTVSDTTARNELALLRENGLITEKEQIMLLKSSVAAAFCTDAEKKELLNLISE